MRKPLLLPAAVIMSLLSLSVAQGRLRFEYEDATVVERSELIVVGHLQKGSIVCVEHERSGKDEGASWEHHATLAVTEVLKGACTEKELPIIIHYGLDPVVGGKWRDGGFKDVRQGNEADPDRIPIIDTGTSSWSPEPVLEDATKDNLWFLRRRGGIYGREPGTGNYGIADPEDIQPLKKKGYFLAYLSPDPETAVKQYVDKNPDKDMLGRSQQYLDHLDIQRILNIQDAGDRCDKLLPFFLKRATWNMKSEARSGIVACGKTAGEKLEKLFDDPNCSAFRQEIILMWRDIGYREVVPRLIELLKRHDRFWAEQQPQKGWWNSSVDSELTRRRRDIYGEVYYGVCALRSFRDIRAREVLEMTLKRWKASNLENPQIAEECEAAIRELP